MDIQRVNYLLNTSKNTFYENLKFSIVSLGVITKLSVGGSKKIVRREEEMIRQEKFC